MGALKRTLFYDNHVQAGATLVDFGGWEMPIQYPSGIVDEHIHTRIKSGIFDVSHMGRFIVSGREATAFLQYVLTTQTSHIKNTLKRCCKGLFLKNIHSRRKVSGYFLSLPANSEGTD